MSERTSAEILLAARARIEPIERWTQGSSAKDALGHGVRPHSPTAVCWCAYGSLDLETPYGTHAIVAEVLRIFDSAAMELFGEAPHHVNDDLGHAAVLRIYDRAIALAEQSDPSLALRDGGANG